MKNYPINQVKNIRLLGRNVDGGICKDGAVRLFWAGATLEILVKAREVERDTLEMIPRIRGQGVQKSIGDAGAEVCRDRSAPGGKLRVLGDIEGNRPRALVGRDPCRTRRNRPIRIRNDRHRFRRRLVVDRQRCRRERKSHGAPAVVTAE